jgi:hypothetical protein
MITKKKINSLLVIAFIAAWLALIGLVHCIERSISLTKYAELIRKIGPHERDIVTEFVAPALSGVKNAEDIIGIMRNRHEESQMLHKGWLDFIEAQREALWLESLLWGSVMIICFGLVVYLTRIYRAL